jgi:predicted molibdopterin-dependent oxidoreductase YjgC
MLVIGDHAAYHDGTLGDVPEALDKLEMLIVTDVFLSPLAQRAHVVLPASTSLEKRGTYTNLERRVQPLKQVFQLKTVQSRPDYHIVADIATRMGATTFQRHGPEEVLDEVAGLVPLYAGVSYGRLLDEAVQTLRPSTDNPMPTQVQYSDRVPMGLAWPCPTADHPGTPRLYADGFQGNQARLGEVPWVPVDRHDDAEFPLLLAHGRVLAQPSHPVEVVRSGDLNRVQREEYLLLHPQDAGSLGLRDGQTARVMTRSGDRVVQGTVRVEAQALRGVVALTTLFADLAVALDASEHPDPMGHMPRLNVVPVRLESV